MKYLAQFCSGLKVRVSNNSLTFHIYNFANNCVSNITANKERCQQLVDSSVGTVTALCPHIGYFRAAKIAKKGNCRTNSCKRANPGRESFRQGKARPNTGCLQHDRAWEISFLRSVLLAVKAATAPPTQVLPPESKL